MGTSLQGGGGRAVVTVITEFRDQPVVSLHSPAPERGPHWVLPEPPEALSVTACYFAGASIVSKLLCAPKSQVPVPVSQVALQCLWRCEGHREFTAGCALVFEHLALSLLL